MKPVSSDKLTLTCFVAQTPVVMLFVSGDDNIVQVQQVGQSVDDISAIGRDQLTKSIHSFVVSTREDNELVSP